MVTASGSYLLFRYIDFDVAPGNAYRYRVRLQVANPNANRPLDEIARADVAQGLYRWTPWSDSSTAVIVPEDVLAFVTDVQHTSSRLPDTIKFDVFQWSTEYGTYANGTVSVNPGQFVGGVQNIEVLDPAGQKFTTENFTFTTRDVLIDTLVPTTLSSNAIKDLNLPRRADIPREVLLMNEFGELMTRDPYSRTYDHKRWIERQKLVADAYAYLRKAQVTEGSEMGMGMGGRIEQWR